jgi:uncharacterized membrane protein
VLSDAPARGSRPPSGSTGTRGRTVAAFVSVVVAGLACYVWTRSDLWLDETLSVNIARLPLADLEAALRHDGAPPLYYMLLHFWMLAFGEGDVTVRLLSAACMVGATVALWFVTRRIAGRTAAWVAVLLMASNPYVIRYATEARMYALELLLVACGMLTFLRALERPSWGRVACFGVVVALLAYTQYWTFYILLVVATLLVVLAWRGEHTRAARRMLVAMVLAGATFVPWLSAFFYQLENTGTPWGTPVLPGIPIGETFRDFAGSEEQEGWLLLLPLVALLLLGIFGRAVDGRHVDIDLRGQPGARGVAIMGGTTLVVALMLNYLGGSAFQTRYSVLVFPFFVVLVARGMTVLTDRRVFIGAVAVVVVLGLIGGVRNATTQRTQAGEVAAVLRADARPGDLVVYCPDQLGPGVERIAPPGLEHVRYPDFGPADEVDWVDYKERLAAADPKAFAHEALARGDGRTVWLVTAPGYTTHKDACDVISQEFAAARSRVVRTVPKEEIFEKPALQEFRARAPGG